VAFVEEVGVAETWVGVGDAGPRSGMAKVSLGDGPERVSLTNGVLGWGARRSDRDGKNNLRSRFNEIWIAKPWIKAEQFLPAPAVSEAFGGEFP